MRRNGLASLVSIVVLAIGGLGWTLAAENEPLLGLDLQGGVSVVLEPTGEFDESAIPQAIEIIRQRVDGIGVAEPEITRQDDAIVVQLPGIADRDQALELVGQTAELRFRPVLQLLPPGLEGLELPGEEPAGEPDADEPDTDEPDADEPDADDEQGFGLAPGELAAPLQAEDPTESDPAPDEPTLTPPAGQDPAELTPPAPPAPTTGVEDLELTSSDDDDPDQPVTLGEFDDDGNEVARYRLGPAAATGEILSSANARIEQLGQWTVGVQIRGDRIADFNVIAGECFNGGPSCPTRQLAIVLDGRVVSAPSINAPSFDADGISISGDFSEGEAKDLALVLRYGSLPVELVAQQTQSVSASIGQDALDAGVLAGLIGLALVTVYMLVYYRLLGMVAMLSLAVSAALLWTMIAWLGSSQGLALTLAGVTGIILSIGVAVDSNVVFYEHLKEEVAGGRSLRAAIDGSFASAFSTIVKADVASLIGAGILYWLTVGPVRGFALFLGLATLLDLISSYFFMRPLALILVKSKRLQNRPRLFGMPTPKVDRGLAIDEGAPA
ncbi:MAG TPA: protein translocase subunit SecD [Acidimicrobiales bacterium]|nr:protein translocase subunit SecD [Acidimicrobiales bacterium]